MDSHQMSIRAARIRFSVALLLGSIGLFTSSTFGQSQASDQGIAIARGSRPKNLEDKAATSAPKPNGEENKDVAKKPKSKDLEGDIEAVKAENAAVRELLRKMEEQQKMLLEQVDRLQRRLDGPAGADLQRNGQPTQNAAGTLPVTNGATLPAAPGDAENNAANNSSQPAPIQTTQASPERYQDGIILWKTPDEARVPFLLRLNAVTQFRYLNTLNSDNSFTDHLGVVRDVHNRNDLTVNRTMFMLNGYIYSKKLQYSLMVWTAAGAASIIVTGSIGWQFNKHITLTGGYMGIPGSRSLTNTFPYFTSTDRTMADNFFRPGFTQGVMASGEITKNLYYNAFIGNSLNTLSITANKIDTNLMGAGSVWWEPLGGYSEPGRSVNMYDDYFAKKKVRIRLGSSFTISREDRFSNLDTSTPENTGVYNSDGVNAFQTGAFALGVTVQNATYKMWAIDGGFKYNGLAINGQYYLRTLSNFDADGPLPLTSTFDHGYEISVGKFVVPRKLMVFGRGSGIFGQFKNPYEYGAGLKWHFLPTERLWLNLELMKVKGSAYSGAFSPYTSGMNGWVPMVQSVLAF
jgi:TolA-binding protein